MSKSPLFWQVYERLVDDEELESLERRLVEASFTSQAAIEEAIEATDTGLATESSVAEEGERTVPGVYLESLEVTGFRGVGETAKIELETSPGLTVIVGRNGSGKSSLAEALEVVLTGDSLRWKDRKQKEWLSGWKNLHYTGDTWVRGSFLVEGAGDTMQVQRRWPSVDFDDGELSVSGAEEGAFENWAVALDTFRPMLSYNEIGHALDAGPSHLYDLLHGVLGMEELKVARDRLAAVRKQLKEGDKDRKAKKAALEKAIESSDDERVEAISEAISKRNADLDVLTDLVLDEAANEDGVPALRRIVSIELPESNDVLEAAENLRAASASMKKAEETFEEQDGKVIEILKRGLSFHEHEEESDCPLCGTEGVLTEDWRKEAEARVEAVESASKARKDAKSKLGTAQKAAERLVARVPSPPDIELDAMEAVLEARNTWVDAPKNPVALAEHLEKTFDAVESTYASLREEATEELRALQAEWRPIRRAIEAFIESEESWRAAKVRVKSLQKSENWLKENGAELRTLRFAPIREEAQAIWETLRHRSNVSLNDIRLEGTRTKRRVELEVAVDGEDAVALGVMSQGELHSMLLSLFLPRLTLDESPFRFLVVDDPVQAMDPAKVDGLARVLAEVAERRQVIVFTHDSRLPEALRRMQIPSRIVEVTRAENSVVAMRDTRSRTEQFISDAFQVANDRHEYGPRVAPEVVPGLCRGALEAHFQSLAWNKLLKAGKTHDEVEAEIANANGVHPLAALAIFGDTARSGDLYGYLNQKVPNGTDTFKTLKDGSHGGFKGDVEQLIRDTRKLLRELGASL